MDLPLRTDYSFYPEEQVIANSHLEDYLQLEMNFRGTIPRRLIKTISHYLQTSEYMFSESRFDDFSQRFHVNMTVYSLMHTIVDLDESEKHRLHWLKSSLCSILSRDPYLLSNPFDIYYVRNYENKKDFSIEDITSFHSFKDPDDHEKSRDFSSFSNASIARGRKALSRAESRYTVRDHFEGAVYGIVFPKISGTRSHKLSSVQKRYDQLCLDHGIFAIRFPEEFIGTRE